MTKDQKLTKTPLTPKTNSSAKPPFEDSPNYTGIMQNKPVNDIAHLNSKRGHADPLSRQIVESGDITAAISAAAEHHFTATESIFFDYVLSQHHHNNSEEDTTVSFTVKQYMDARGLKNLGSAKKQIDNALSTFLNTTISYGGTHKKRRPGAKDIDAFSGLNIVSAASRVRGQVEIHFTPEFNEIITARGMFMPYSKATFRINTHSHPHAYYIVRKMQEQKRISHGKPNENSMKIGSLLKAIPSLPTYEEVSKGNRNYYDRIIDPFFRDLGETPEVSDIFNYSFMNPEGQPFTEHDHENLTYDRFINSTLVIDTWVTYPEQAVNSWKETAQHYIDQATAKAKKHK